MTLNSKHRLDKVLATVQAKMDNFEKSRTEKVRKAVEKEANLAIHWRMKSIESQDDAEKERLSRKADFHQEVAKAILEKYGPSKSKA